MLDNAWKLFGRGGCSVSRRTKSSRSASSKPRNKRSQRSKSRSCGRSQRSCRGRQCYQLVEQDLQRTGMARNGIFQFALLSRQMFPCGVCHLVFLRSCFSLVYWHLNGRHLRPRVQRKDLERVQQKDLQKEKERVQQRQKGSKRDRRGIVVSGHVYIHNVYASLYLAHSQDYLSIDVGRLLSWSPQ